MPHGQGADIGAVHAVFKLQIAMDRHENKRWHFSQIEIVTACFLFMLIAIGYCRNSVSCINSAGCTCLWTWHDHCFDQDAGAKGRSGKSWIQRRFGLNFNNPIKAVAESLAQIREEMTEEPAVGITFDQIEPSHAMEGLKKAIVVPCANKKDTIMGKNDNERRLCCTRCNATLKSRDEVECYDFNGRVAICRRCANLPGKSPAGMISGIGRFFNRRRCEQFLSCLPGLSSILGTGT